MRLSQIPMPGPVIITYKDYSVKCEFVGRQIQTNSANFVCKVRTGKNRMIAGIRTIKWGKANLINPPIDLVGLDTQEAVNDSVARVSSYLRDWLGQFVDSRQ